VYVPEWGVLIPPDMLDVFQFESFTAEEESGEMFKHPIHAIMESTQA